MMSFEARMAPGGSNRRGTVIQNNDGHGQAADGSSALEAKQSTPTTSATNSPRASPQSTPSKRKPRRGSVLL